MSSIRVPCKSTRSRPRNLRGLYFGSSLNQATYVNVATTIPDVETLVSKRFPSFESVLGTQSYIHECLVDAIDAEGKVHQFIVAYRENSELPANRALQEVLPGAVFNAEALVMRAGVRVLVVDLKGRKDVALAKGAVRSFLREVVARRARNGRRQPDYPVRLA